MPLGLENVNNPSGVEFASYHYHHLALKSQ